MNVIFAITYQKLELIETIEAICYEHLTSQLFINKSKYKFVFQ